MTKTNASETRSTAVTHTLDTAESSVGTAEFAQAVSSCAAAVERELSAATEALFPSMFSEPTTADAIAQYKLAMEPLSQRDAIDLAASAHRNALARNPGLCALLRSTECAAEVASIATRSTHGDEWRAARRLYLVAIAGQLKGDAARGYLDAVALEDRLIAAKAAHEEALRSAAERVKAERVTERQRQLAELDAEFAAAEKTYRGSSIGDAAAAEREFVRARNQLLAKRIRVLELRDIRSGSSVWSADSLLPGLELGNFSDVQCRVLESAVRAS